MPLHYYGENSATFLIFQALCRDGKIKKLLGTLQAAGDGHKIDEKLFDHEDVDVWLFPNFGKRHGFGEPDALVTQGGQVRFQGRRHLAILGPTASNSGQVKFGILRVSGHPVLRAIRERLMQSTPHLVLMSVSAASGAGGGIVYSDGLGSIIADVFNSIGNLLQVWSQQNAYAGPLPQMASPEKNVWYTYWRGNASSKCYPDGNDPLTQGECKFVIT
jgi:hypothetical protein